MPQPLFIALPEVIFQGYPRNNDTCELRLFDAAILSSKEPHAPYNPAYILQQAHKRRANDPYEQGGKARGLQRTPLLFRDRASICTKSIYFLTTSRIQISFLQRLS